MHNKNRITVRAALTYSKAGVAWLILVSASAAFFAVGFILGITRVVLGLYQEHRKFAYLTKLAKTALDDIRIASGLTHSTARPQAGIA